MSPALSGTFGILLSTMPELPEVEIVRRQLEKCLVGQTISRFEVVKPRSLHGDLKRVIGQKIVASRRLGKMLVIDLSGNYCLAIHFKMSGQLILDQKSAPRIVGGHPTEDWVGKLPGAHTRVIFYFKSGDVMYFNDQRMFGWVKILEGSELADLPFVKKLGPEPWDIGDAKFYNLIKKRKKPIKLVMMDQAVVSGVGNIYANDGLWEAKIDPRRNASELISTEIAAIREGIIKVLQAGIKYGGATATDAKYLDLGGMGGKYQEHFRTYAREGEECRRGDGGIINKVILGGRGTYFCPVCQR